MLELAQTPGGNTRFGFGGDTLNTAVYMARELDAAETANRVSYVTALGDDPFSDDLVQAWQGEGVDCSLVERLPGALPGLYCIRTDQAGERSFYYWREQAAVRGLLDNGHDVVLASALADYDLLYLSAISLAIFLGPRRDRLFRLLESCYANQVRIAFDTNFRPRLWPDRAEAIRAYERVARYCSYVLPSLDDEVALFGASNPAQCLDHWTGWGAGEVIVKAAQEGCHLVADEQRFTVPVSEVIDPVDTTAAGDAFAAAYLVARLRGDSPLVAATCAHGLAAKVITHLGAIVPA